MLLVPLKSITDKAFLAIDKPPGITSFTVIRYLRKITGIKKIGHTGTLDPFATGLLICCLGSYTRLAGLLEEKDKTYFARMKLGIKTATGDPEGDIIQTAPVPAFVNKLDVLAGKAEQLTELPVPLYSAVKINGKRAYELARKGKKFNLPERPLQIREFEFLPLEPNKSDELSYRCKVSKGTYIRALSEWLAEQLNTIAYTTFLLRESIGNITLQDAVSLDDLSPDNWFRYQLSYKQIFPDYAYLKLKTDDFAKVMNGMDIAVSNGTNDKYLLLKEEKICAVAKRMNNLIHPVIVLK